MLTYPRRGKSVIDEGKYYPSCGRELKRDVEMLRVRLEGYRYIKTILVILLVISLAVMLGGIWLDTIAEVRYYGSYFPPPSLIMTICGFAMSVLSVVAVLYFVHKIDETRERL